MRPTQVREGMKIPVAQLSHEDLTLLIQCLDDEGDGQLSINEISDFVQYAVSWLAGATASATVSTAATVSGNGQWQQSVHR